MNEPFLTRLTRYTGAAAVLGAILLVALPRRGSLFADYVDTFTVAFCFTFIGAYVDALLLGLPGIHTTLGRAVRLAGWFAGGLWCYVIARWLWIKYGRDVQELPGLVWGGVAFVVAEVVLHLRDRSARDSAR